MNHVAIVGVGQTHHQRRRGDVNVPGLVREAAQRALADANLTMDDIDSVVVASGPVLFAAVNLPDKWVDLRLVFSAPLRTKSTDTWVVFLCTDVTLSEGTYYGGWRISNKVVLTLGPGMYVIAGGGISIAGTGEITSVSGGGGPAAVMIFNTDSPTCPTGPCQTDVTMSTKSSLDLRPIASGPYRGILIWNDGNVKGSVANVELLGGTNLDIGGTVYSPKGFVKVDGGGTVVGNAAIQIISWTWDVGGNSGLDMPYDPNGLFHFDSKGLVR